MGDEIQWKNPPCPHLPAVGGRLGPAVTRRHGPQRGAGYYLDALRYAQSLWMDGKPAQALLQLNKAWLAELGGGAAGDDAVPEECPPPYRALAWLLDAGRTGQQGFLGNPVRHFQHLASRMSGPQAVARSWRAWTCFHLAGRVLGGGGEFPRDGEQLAREGLWIPSQERALHALDRHGWPGEAAVAAGVFRTVEAGHSAGSAAGDSSGGA